MSANIVDLVSKIAAAQTQGINLLEIPTREGGIFVDDETIAIAADMEVVARDHFVDFGEFNQHLLLKIQAAKLANLDVLTEIKTWLATFANDEQQTA
jgi:hypothetical protein